MNPNLNNLDFDSGQEINNAINNIMDEIKIKFAELRTLQIAVENMKACNRELVADKRKLQRSIECINERVDLSEQLNEALRVKLKDLEKSYGRMTAFKTKSFKELISEFSSQLALCQVAHLRSQQAKQKTQPPTMPPSTSDQPPNAQRSPRGSDFSPKN